MAGFGGGSVAPTGGGAYIGPSGPTSPGIGASGYTGPDPEAERRRKREEARIRSQQKQDRMARETRDRAASQRRDQESRRESERQQQAMEARMNKMQQSMQPIGGGGGAGPALGTPGAITGGAGGGGIAGFQGGGFQGGGIQSTAGGDPNLQFWEGERREELEASQQPADMSRQRGIAATGIAGAAAGREAQLEEEMVGRGLGTREGLGARERRQIGEGAQTDIAMAGAGIEMEGERQRTEREARARQAGSQFAGEIGGAARSEQAGLRDLYRAQTGRRAQDVQMRGQDINAQMGRMGLWANLMAG